jgi:purine catabolism regulator
VAGWLVVISGERPAGLAVVQHVGAIAALYVMMRRHEREILRRSGGETLAELLRGVVDPPTAVRRLTRGGFSRDADLALCAIQGFDGADRAVVAVLEKAGLPHMLLSQHEVVYVLAPGGEALQSALAAAIAGGAGGGSTGAGAGGAAGISRTFAPGSPVDVPRPGLRLRA